MPCINFTKDMQVVVLLGGLGSRLGNLTRALPKPMIEVIGKPFFSYMLELLSWYGFRRFHFCVGHLGEDIQNYFGNGSKFGVDITYSFDGEKLLGTAGALRNALDSLEENFMLIYGDSYMDIDYNELIYRYFQSQKHNGAKILMAIYKNKNLYDKSNVIFRNGQIICYDKKNQVPEMEYIDYGISILSRKLIADLAEGKPADLADLYSKAVCEGIAAAHPVRKRFYEIGTPASLEEFRELVQRRSRKQKAVILDRDGTLNEIIYDENTEQFDSPLHESDLRILPNTCQALRILKSLGYLLIVVTNQPAGSKGKTTLSKLFDINRRMNKIFEDEGISLDDVLMCPHHPTGNSKYCSHPSLICDCPGRKPGSLLINEAVKKHNIDIRQSFMVGDSCVDILAGEAEQLSTVFLGRFKCDVCQSLGQSKPNFVFGNLYEFAKYLKVENNENN